MSVAIMMHRGLSLRRALASVGSSQGAYYHRPKEGAARRSDAGSLRDPSVLAAIRDLALRKPMYGSRMMVALLSRELGRPVSRKLVQHAFRVLGWTTPQDDEKRGPEGRERQDTQADGDQRALADRLQIGKRARMFLYSIVLSDLGDRVGSTGDRCG